MHNKNFMKNSLLIVLVLSFSFLFSGCDLTKTETKNSVKEMREELAKNVLSFEADVYSDETPKYIIDVKYPEIKYSDFKFEKYGKAINDEISAHIKDKIDYFISEVEAWGSTKEDIEMTMKSGLYTSYEITTLNPKLISIRFDNSIYHAGAAHPDTYTTVLNYDVENDNEIIIADVFKADSGWEQALSDYIVPELNEKLITDFEFDDSEWVLKGAGPKHENFTVFTFSDDGITFTWDLYIVAPYAAGPQSIFVPYSEIEEYLSIKAEKYFDN
jgi:hypothetical protein